MAAKRSVRAPRFERADATVSAACGTRFTAAVLRIELGGLCVFERAHGAVDDSGGAAVDGMTCFDLASLTKPFVATAALRAIATGALALDEPLVEIVPEWRGSARKTVTLRRLLAHDAGLQSGADYRLLLGTDVECYALERPPVAAVGERVVYSDLGFIALGVVLARRFGCSLGAILGETCVALGAEATTFRPPGRARKYVPATEDDGWRGRLRGVVHDEKAYLMGGVAGHAGLFGTAHDVARVAEAFLGPANGRCSNVLPPELARDAIREQAFDPVLRRGLGWALKTTDDNSCGARMSSATFGHTGFVGTCVWADPARDVSVTLLTNAVYYGRGDLRDLRAAVCDAAIAALED